MAAALGTDFIGRKGALFGLALRLSILTVVTLGFYRFWMKTRLRRWYWSAIRPGGHPLEYTGDPLEKLLGFLIAVVFLSFYIGVFNLILMFFSFSYLGDNFVAYAASFVIVIPFIFFAQYRARRYMLARTRWRGIRFGLEPGAWGYAWRAMVYWALTIVTLGALWPLMTFRLEKFRTDRTWFGSARLFQGGRWTALILPAIPALLCLWGTLALGLVAAVTEDPTPVLGLVLTLPLLGIAWVHYRLRALRYLTETKRLGEDVGLTLHPRLGRVLAITVFGHLLVGLFLGLLLGGVGVAVGIVLGIGAAGGVDFEALPPWVFVVAGMVAYFGGFILWDVLRQVFVRMPLLAHYVATLEIDNAHALAPLAQRERDDFADAGGFAEALDVGAAL